MPAKEHTAPVRPYDGEKVPSPENPSLPLEASKSQRDQLCRPNAYRFFGNVENAALSLAVTLCGESADDVEDYLSPVAESLLASPMFALLAAWWDGQVVHRFANDRGFSMAEFAARIYAAGVCAAALGVRPVDLVQGRELEPAVLRMFAALSKGGAA